MGVMSEISIMVEEGARTVEDFIGAGLGVEAAKAAALIVENTPDIDTLDEPIPFGGSLDLPYERDEHAFAIKGKADAELPTESQFEKYERVRRSGMTNMFDVNTVRKFSGLALETIGRVMDNYDELSRLYPDVVAEC